MTDVHFEMPLLPANDSKGLANPCCLSGPVALLGHPLELGAQPAHLLDLVLACLALIERLATLLDPADTPRRAATSLAGWPRSVTCLTASALNSSVYLFPLMTPFLGLSMRLAGV